MVDKMAVDERYKKSSRQKMGVDMQNGSKLRKTVLKLQSLTITVSEHDEKCNFF